MLSTAVVDLSTAHSPHHAHPSVCSKPLSSTGDKDGAPSGADHCEEVHPMPGCQACVSTTTAVEIAREPNALPSCSCCSGGCVQGGNTTADGGDGDADGSVGSVSRHTPKAARHQLGLQGFMADHDSSTKPASISSMKSLY